MAAVRAGRLRRSSTGPHDHGPGAELTRLETERLRLDPVTENDLQLLHEVFRSNPQHLEWAEGGEYELETLREDWQAARGQKGRHMLALRERDAGALVGVIDYLEVNDADGHPWIGLIMTSADRQREGLAAEAIVAVCEHVHLNWASPIRLAVIDQNTAGLALAVSLGFEQYGEAFQDLGVGEQRLVLMQRRV
jgi:RimJ/RimL family protein N-acetyltransferase